MPSTKDLITAHRAITDRLEALEAAHKKKTGAFKQVQVQLENEINKIMAKEGSQSVKIDGVGTAYKQGWTKIKVLDWQQTLQWLLENEHLDLLTRQLAKNETLARLEELSEEKGETVTIPGIEIEKGKKLNIRRT